MLSRPPSPKALGLRALVFTLLLATVNTGCNLEQFFEKKPKTATTPTVDDSVTWWSTNPFISPSAGVSLKGRVLGVVNVIGATVNLYSDSTCSSFVATGNETDITTGIQFTVAANGIASVYAKVVDSISNTSSSCTYVGQYLSVSPTVSPIYSSQGSNWNDYVINNGTTIFNSNGAACSGIETNGYLSCLHGAEMKKVVVTGATSCSGLTLTDNLDAFIWTCQVVSGTATFYSVALKPFKGLKDLITGTSWRNMSVTITSSAGSISSPSSAWWSNTITALPDNSTGGSGVASLSTSGTIYTLSASRATEGYAITASKIAIVTLGGAELSYVAGASNFNSTTGLTSGVANTRAMIDAANQNYLWLELNLTGSSSAGTLAQAPILGRSLKHLRIKNSNLRNSANKILDFNSVNKSAVLDSKLTDSSNAALEFDASSDSIVARVHIANTSQGAYAYGSSKMYFSELSSVGVDGYALKFDNSSSGTAAAISAINSAYVGIDLWDSSNATIHNALAINVASNAIGGGSSSTITGNTLSQLAIGDSPVGLGLQNSTSSKITGNVVFAGSTTNCSASNSGSGFTSACVNAGLGNASFLEKTAASFAASIVGKIATDIQNASDTSGTATYPTALNIGAFDFLSFSSWFRSWGKEGAAFPASDNQGRFSTTSTAGRIWDSRPVTSDTHIFNRTHSLTTTNSAITANAACPAQLRGDVYLTDQQSRKYLKNAIEFVGDNRGNENGLCESGEVCVYTPNFGGYQGEGALFSNSCIFSDNGDAINNVTGVTMYFYPTNGV